MNKLLFAVRSPGQLTATYVTPDGHTRAKTIRPEPRESAALMTEVDVGGASGFQVFTAHADPTGGGKRVEVLGNGGVMSTFNPADLTDVEESPVAAARDALLAVLTEAVQEVA